MASSVPPTEKRAEIISEAKALAKSGNVSEALDSLLSLEKTCRLNAEVEATVIAAAAVIEVCFESNDWKALNDHILIISKRRSQLKQAITKVVQMNMEYLEIDPSPFDYDSKIELIETLRSVSAGKLFVENEGARLTRKLAMIRESEGKVEEAADILQEVAPETLGSMPRKEKVNFILEQMRLALAKKDFIRAGIISQKISNRAIESENFESEKETYHRQMIEFYHDSSRYLDIARSYFALYSSKLIQSNEEKMLEMLKRVVAFLVLSPFDNEQSDFLARVKTDKKLENIPAFAQIVKLFTTHELIAFPMSGEIMTNLSDASPIWDAFYSEKISEALHKRVIEHNIRVIGKYYSRMRSTRLAQLLDLSEDEMERRLSDMVCSGVLWARIDRVGGVVTFRKKEVASDTLNGWATDISSLLNRIEETCHLIRKENVVHGIKA